MKSLIKISLVVFFACFSAAAFAQEKSKSPAPEPSKSLPKSGTLAGTTTGGFGNTSFDGIWGSEKTVDGSDAPVSASVSKGADAEYVVKVFNNSEDQYRMSLELIQVNDNNRVLKTDNFTLTLKGKQRAERKFRANAATKNASVRLVNWKMTAKKKSPEELKEELNKTKERLKELEAEVGEPAKPLEKRTEETQDFEE